MKALIKETSAATVQCKHETLGKFTFTADIGQDGKHPNLLFTENETNSEVKRNNYHGRLLTIQ